MATIQFNSLSPFDKIMGKTKVKPNGRVCIANDCVVCASLGCWWFRGLPPTATQCKERIALYEVRVAGEGGDKKEGKEASYLTSDLWDCNRRLIIF